MTDKDFTMVILDKCQITLENGSLVVLIPGTSFNMKFNPGDKFYIEILNEYMERNDIYSRNLWKKYHLLFDTACKMAPFFKIDYDRDYCIKDDEENFMELTREEFDCFKGVLGKAIDRGYGLMFNKLKK